MKKVFTEEEKRALLTAADRQANMLFRHFGTTWFTEAQLANKMPQLKYHDMVALLSDLLRYFHLQAAKRELDGATIYRIVRDVDARKMLINQAMEKKISDHNRTIEYYTSLMEMITPVKKKLLN